MHREGYEGYGAMFPTPGRKYCGEALHMKRAEHCIIEKNHFHAVGGNGIYLEDYNARNVIRNNEISHAGACGVVLIGSKYFHPVPHHPIYNEVVDNHIHHCGVFDKYVAGVFLGLSDGNLIGHNLIEYVPHHAINFGNSGYGRNIIEYNEIRHACLETYDNAAINCWMEDPNNHVQRDAERSGHVIRYNLIADIRGCIVPGFLSGEGSTFGIYLDALASNCLVYGNIIVRSTSVGIAVNGGKNNIIENNIIVDCKYQIRTWSPSMYYYPHTVGFMTGNRYCRNIFYRSHADGNLYFLCHWTDRVLGQSDYNLFFSAVGEGYNIEQATEPGLKTIPFAEWQKMGYDVHSVITEPMFVDPEHDDYRLRPESPALKFGFVPIDVAKIGPRGKEPK